MLTLNWIGQNIIILNCPPLVKVPQGITDCESTFKFLSHLGRWLQQSLETLGQESGNSAQYLQSKKGNRRLVYTLIAFTTSSIPPLKTSRSETPDVSNTASTSVDACRTLWTFKFWASPNWTSHMLWNEQWFSIR